MANTRDLKYGILRRGSGGSYPLPIGASEVFKNRGGKFVINDGSGRGEVAGDGDTELIGWVEMEEATASSTEGGDIRNCVNDTNAVFRIPLAYDGSTYTVNYSASLLGKTCDLVVVSSYQKANLTTSTEDVVIIVGGLAASSTTADDGYVDVKLNPSKLGTTGVA